MSDLLPWNWQTEKLAWGDVPSWIAVALACGGIVAWVTRLVRSKRASEKDLDNAAQMNITVFGGGGVSAILKNHGAEPFRNVAVIDVVQVLTATDAIPPPHGWRLPPTVWGAGVERAVLEPGTKWQVPIQFIEIETRSFGRTKTREPIQALNLSPLGEFRIVIEYDDIRNNHWRRTGTSRPELIKKRSLSRAAMVR